MRRLIFAGVALSVAQPALAEIDSGVGAPPPPAHGAANGAANGAAHGATHHVQAVPPMADMPPPPPPRPVTADGRWHGGHQAPGGWSAYRAPGYGDQLSRYWMTQSFHIADYRAHGLDRPATGFGWSRYYDDAVLTDQWGRVYDTRGNHDWGRSNGSSSRRNSHDGDAAIAGIGGAAVGAVAGNLIAGAGSRLAGSLIGGGVGALAGLAIEAITNKHKRSHGGYGDDRRQSHDDGRHHEGFRGAHWGGQSWGGHSWGGGFAYAADCGCDMVTTITTTTTHGGSAMMVPHRVVTYENVYAVAPARTKMKERRTTKLRPRVRGDY